MRCRKVRSFLSAYSNEELTGRREISVREHLAGCAACRREVAIYDALRGSSRELSGMAVSQDFNTKLLNRIARERFGETRSRAYLPHRAPAVSWRLVIPVAATAVLAVFMAVNLMTPLPSDTDQPLANLPGQRDDLYRTIQPVNNPNMADNLQKDWSLNRQMAMAERINRISAALTDVTGFSGLRMTGSTGRSILTGSRPAPYAVNYYRVQPVFRVYQDLSTTGTQEDEKVY